MRFSWIAVALATAIRLYAPVELRTVIVTAALAIGGAIVARTNARTNARTKPQRIAAVFLLLVALVDGTSLWRAQTLSQSFPRHLSDHLQHDLEDVRNHIAALERELEASAIRIAQRTAGKENDRAALFGIVAAESTTPGRGARILSDSGELIAWW